VPITNFLNFTTNAVPTTADYLVGFVDDAGNRGQYEYKTTFQSLFNAYGTYASGLSGITPSQLSTGHPMWNAGGDFTVPGQLNANNAIVGSSTISTTNGTIFSQGATNAVAVYDRNGSGAYASFYKVGGNNYLAGTTSGTVITYTSAGNVGVGTTTPNTTLTVNGSISANNVINAYQGYGTSGPLGAYAYFDRNGNGTAGAIFRQSGVNQLWDNNAGTVVAYTSSGNVGVGTTNPNKTLTVVGDISATGRVYGTGTISVTSAAPVYGCRAWVNFDGTRDASGVVSTANTNRFIRSSGNVASVLRNATGDYTVNFATAMADANYSVTGGASDGVNANTGAFGFKATTLATGSIRVNTHNYAGTIARVDASNVYVQIFGN